MIILNEIMDTMSQEKRAIILDRISNRKRYRNSTTAVSDRILNKSTRRTNEISNRSLQSNIKKYGITINDLPDDHLRNGDIRSKDVGHVLNQQKRLIDKQIKRINAEQNGSSNNTSIPKTEAPKSNGQPPKVEVPNSNGQPPKVEAPKTTSKSNLLSRNKGKVALGIGAAAAYGIHRYRKNKKKKEEEAKRQAEEAQNKKSSGLKRFLNR